MSLLYVPIFITACFSTGDQAPNCTKEHVDEATAKQYQTASYRRCIHEIKHDLIKELHTIAAEEGETIVIDHFEIMCALLRQNQA